MRIWSIHPQYLDWMGLGAQWREGLLAQKVLQGETKGWRNHPQLDRFKEHPQPIEAIGFYLKEIHNEAISRKYNYNFSKILEPSESIQRIELNQGQIIYEFEILQNRLKDRTPKKYQENLGVSEVIPHPLFILREGTPEFWEKAYWRNQEQQP
jgi:hypothetical protein